MMFIPVIRIRNKHNKIHHEVSALFSAINDEHLVMRLALDRNDF